MPEYALQDGQTVLDVIVDAKMVASKSEGRRMLKQNAVRLDGKTLNDPNQPFPHSGVLQVGKRRFIQVNG
jgi:tyrosyl-tRNA synthetase